MSRESDSPRARLLLTGDELLRGFVQDANSGFVAEQLRDLGIELLDIRIVGDDHREIEAAVAAASSDGETDLLVVTGGLGPTHDDRTSEAVARAAGLQLELDDDALALVESRVRAFGRMRTAEEVETFTPGNRKQATFPAGSTWVDPLGTAPGYAMRCESGLVVVVLPGPPSELRHAWSGIRATRQLTELIARVGERHERLVRVWAVPESRAARLLSELGHEDSPARRLTLCARDGELELSVRGTDARAIDDLVTGLCDGFGDAVFAVDDHRPIAEIVGAELTARGWRLGCAESCTGGMVGAAITAVPGSSEWFVGSLVTYANEAKTAVAHVSKASLAEHGAVSEQVARELADGARVVLNADVAVGITGIAGPGGGSDDKPVGTVHFAVSMRGDTRHRHVRIPGDRATVRRRAVGIALHELRLALGSIR